MVVTIGCAYGMHTHTKFWWHFMRRTWKDGVNYKVAQWISFPYERSSFQNRNISDVVGTSLKMEAIGTSETLVSYHNTTLHHNTEDGNLYLHRSENFKCRNGSMYPKLKYIYVQNAFFVILTASLALMFILWTYRYIAADTNLLLQSWSQYKVIECHKFFALVIHSLFFTSDNVSCEMCIF
jgi:hypothetical protein